MKWLAERYVDLELGSDQQAYSHYNWIKTGLVYAVLMFILMTGLTYLTGTLDLAAVNLAVSVLTWSFGGLQFGYGMKLFIGKKGQEAVPHSN